MKGRTKYVFIVLVYRNYNDLYSFIDSIRKKSIKSEIVIVNSFFDEYSKEECYKIAKKNKCHFLSINNKGYSYGNNIGIEYAKNNFEFEFLIVSNPDVIIYKFHDVVLNNLRNTVIGPQIKTITGKNQNPHWVVNLKIFEWLNYIGHKYKITFLIYFVVIIHKILREIFIKKLKRNKISSKKVYSLHGSFIIFPKEVLNIINLPFNAEMFLFAEELYLASLLKIKGISSNIVKDIEIIHKEDGSVKFVNNKILKYTRDSVCKYYSFFKKNKKLG